MFATVVIRLIHRRMLNVKALSGAPVEAVIKARGVDFRIGGNRAFYARGPDIVQAPPPHACFVPIYWHRTVLYELGHATGHVSCLGRDLSGSFGTKKFGFVELVAEINAAFRCASIGIVPTVRHADYVGSWHEVMREDNRAIERAAGPASKAADYLLNFLPSEDEASRAFSPSSLTFRRLSSRADRPCPPVAHGLQQGRFGSADGYSQNQSDQN